MKWKVFKRERGTTVGLPGSAFVGYGYGVLEVDAGRILAFEAGKSKSCGEQGGNTPVEVFTGSPPSEGAIVAGLPEGGTR